MNPPDTKSSSKAAAERATRPLWRSYELLISLAMGMLVLGLQHFGVLDRFELATLDMRFVVRGPVEPDPRVLYVEMAEDGISNLGRWPWSRDWHATYLAITHRFSPAATMMDIIFSEPSREEGPDAEFAAALDLADNVYLPMVLEYPGEGIAHRLYPLERFRKAIRGTGHIGVRPDRDGVVRRIPLFEKRGAEMIPQVSFQLALDHLGVPLEHVQIIPGKWVVVPMQGASPIFIPVDEDLQVILNWAGRWADTFAHVSYYETLIAFKQMQTGEEPVLDLEEVYKDRIALVGLTAAGLFDTKPTPFESLHPMVGVHGNLISNILQRNFLWDLPKTINLASTVALALITGVLMHGLGPVLGALISLMLVLSGGAATYWAFVEKGLIVQWIAPTMAVIFSFVGIGLYRYVVEERKKRWIKNAFSHYLSPSVIDNVLKNPDQLRLGGQRVNMTVMFSDVRDFTTFSERHSPEDVVHLLNEYLDTMTKVILRNGGTIDKFMGDEVMAYFGAPMPLKPREHAYLAVKTATEMSAALRTLHEKWEREGKPLLGMGVGINSGEVICGNMGSTEIFDYTVIGDNVNIGARVERLTRKYECDIILTESTYELIKDAVDVTRLDSITVKGRSKPITIYALTGCR